MVDFGAAFGERVSGLQVGRDSSVSCCRLGCGLAAPEERGSPAGISVDEDANIDGVTVDLDALPTDLAHTIRAARIRRGVVALKPFVSNGPDTVIGEWAKSILASGELDAAIAEVAASDPDLAS